MTVPTFTWLPDIDSRLACEPTVSVTKFGDGYEARAANGINSQPDKWSLTFTRSREESSEILAFLRERGAIKSFVWVNPLGETGAYVCRAWDVTSKRGMLQVMCDFQRVFEVVQ